MIELWYYVKSDFFKLRNSSFFGAHILFPISGVALVLLYAVFAAVSDINKIAVFFSFLLSHILLLSVSFARLPQSRKSGPGTVIIF